MCSGTSWKISRWVEGTSGRVRPLTSNGISPLGVASSRNDECQQAIVFLDNVDAVVPKGLAGGFEELRRRHGIGKAQGDEVRLLAQPGRDVEREAQPLVEDLVDENRQRRVVETRADGRAFQVLAQASHETSATLGPSGIAGAGVTRRASTSVSSSLAARSAACSGNGFGGRMGSGSGATVGVEQAVITREAAIARGAKENLRRPRSCTGSR